MVWYGMVWYGVVWYCLVWYGRYVGVDIYTIPSIKCKLEVYLSCLDPGWCAGPTPLHHIYDKLPFFYVMFYQKLFPRL